MTSKRRALGLQREDVLQFVVEGKFSRANLRTIQAALLGAVPLSQGTVQVIGVGKDQKLGRQVSVIEEWIRLTVQAAKSFAHSA